MKVCMELRVCWFVCGLVFLGVYLSLGVPVCVVGCGWLIMGVCVCSCVCVCVCSHPHLCLPMLLRAYLPVSV